MTAKRLSQGLPLQRPAGVPSCPLHGKSCSASGWNGTICWVGNRTLAASCATHARLFFGSADLGLTTAAHGTFTLAPTAAMREALRADYAAMAGMIFGDVPPLDAVLASIDEIESRVNAQA